MDHSSSDDSDFSDSEFTEFKDKPLQQLRNGTLKVKYPNGIFRCPFCAGKKKQSFKYKDLHQHASGVGKGSSNKNAKQKANHLALTIYLENDLANESEQPPPKVAAPISEENDLFCWPWTGIVVNIVNDPVNGDDVEKTEYWMKRFSKYKPEGVEILIDDGDDDKKIEQVLVRFKNDLTGYKNACDFEKAFEDIHHSREEWISSENSSSDSIYAWLACSVDFESQGQLGHYLRKTRELKTLSDIQQEYVKTKKQTVIEVMSELDMTNEEYDDLQSKYYQNNMSLCRILEEKENLQKAFDDERRNIQICERERVERVLEERDSLISDLEKKRKELDLRNKEINKKEALTERDKQKLKEEKEKNEMQNDSLQLASIEQNKNDESVSRLLEKHKREKEEAMKEVFELEKKLEAKQKLEMEIEGLNWKVKMMKHLGDGKDNVAVQETIKEMENEMEAKMEEFENAENLNQALVYKERERNDELQDARKVTIKGLQDRIRGWTSIGVKRMGEIDMKVFHEACKEKFSNEEAQIKASELCSLWQDKLKNPEWHPMKVVLVNGEHKEIINEDDELLKKLKAEWGMGIFDAAVNAFKEMHEYNASGGYVVNELWNFKENRKAPLKEAIEFIVKNVKSLKRKR